MKAHLWLIRVLSRLVPRRWRPEWQQEWEAELRYRESQGRPDLVRRSLGAFWDALAMQPRRLEEELFQDLRFGIRMFTTSRVLTITAIVSLALGIGANTALFSMVDTVLLKKLPVRNPDELVLFQWTGWGVGITSLVTDRDLSGQLDNGDTFTYRAFQQFRAQNQTLADVFGFAKPYDVNLTVDNKAEIGIGQWVSGNFFKGLGVSASLGRTISDIDDQPSAAPSAVISHRYWERRFALDPAALGKTISVNNTPFTIIGISANDFTGTLQVDEAADVFLPMSFEPAVRGKEAYLPQADAWWVYVMGRTRRGIRLDQVQANLQGALDDAVLAGVQAQPEKAQTPQADKSHGATPRLGFFPGSRGLVDRRQNFEKPLLVLVILVAVVLLIASANVANLLLSRAATRQKEMAVRLALGAGRFRLVRQLLTESLLLAAAGGVGGILLAFSAKDLLLRWGPWVNSATPLTLKLDLRALAFTVGVSIVTGILFGTVPAFASARRDLNSTVKDHSRTLAGGRSYAGKVLLILQVTLSVVLLIGAGLFVRTMWNLRAAVTDLQPETLLQFDVDPTLAKLDPPRVVPLFEEMITQIGAIPGVRSVSLGSRGDNFLGFQDPASGRRFSASYVQIRENFFDTMGIKLLAGRTFTPTDNSGNAKVVIVNEAFAHKYFPDVSPLGKTANGEIVGIVRDTKLGRLRRDAPPMIYHAYRQGSYGRITFRVRTKVDPASIIPAVRQAVQRADSRVPLSNLKTLSEQFDQTLAIENMFAGLSTLFGALALILTCIGFYGVMTYSVARRTNEIGIRMALGAERVDVLRLVLNQGLGLVFIGSALGIAIAVASSRYIASILYGLAPDDGLTIAAAVVVMTIIAGFAAFIPARRASRIDPLVALRYE